MDERDIQTLIHEELLVDLREDTASHARAPLASERRNRSLALVVSGVIVSAVLMGGVVYGVGRTEQVTVAPREHVLSALPVYPVTPASPNPYESIVLEADAVAVFDVRTGTMLHGRNANTSLPIASLTKIMTALLAAEVSEEGARLAIHPFAIETEGDSGLFANETWTVRDLIDFTMLVSSNDGADALAVAVGGLLHSTPETAPAYVRVNTFVEHMNRRAREIGLTETRYRNATGLDESVGVGGAVGTAEDMARLISYTWEHAPEALAHTTEVAHTFTSEDGFIHDARNTNPRVHFVPGMLGSKTGYTDLAGGNLAIVYNSGLDNPIAIVVLGSTLNGRFDDVEKLVDATYASIQSGWYAYTVAGSTPESS